MNYVEDNEYLGSCEDLCPMALPVGFMVGEWVLSHIAAGLPSWMSWYNL